MFCEIPTFKEIVNMAYQMPIYMYAISVDATMKPLKMEEERIGNAAKTSKNKSLEGWGD